MLKSGFLTFSGDIEMEHWLEMVKLQFGVAVL